MNFMLQSTPINKKIAIFSEAGYYGKMFRDYQNARTDITWAIVLNANHISFSNMASLDDYDLGIVIIPKNIKSFLNSPLSFDKIKDSCKKVAIMQEGPNNYFQNYEFYNQLEYYKILLSADFLFCHNELDKKYYKGLTCLKTYVLPSVMIEDTISYFRNNPKINKTIIGGNFVEWYSGFDSFIIASEFNNKINIPTMGRATKEELSYINKTKHLFYVPIEHLTYYNWTEWMKILSQYKYAVHLMRTFAAGSFSLNTSYFGIPTIGYNNVNTQSILHPHTSVDLGDLESARNIAHKLKNDKDFYDECSRLSYENYKEYYHEHVFVKYFNRILNEIFK